MACRLITFPDGTTAIVCGPRGNHARSCDCGSGKTADRLCDYQHPRLRYLRKSGSKTCDRRICADCALHVGDDLDYCREHAAMAPAGDQPSLF